MFFGLKSFFVFRFKKVVMSVVKPVIAMSVVKGCFSSSVYEFANLESSRICNQVDNFMDLSSQIPARYSAPINHLASGNLLDFINP